VLEEFLQLLMSGLASGCVYGLVALGFVLIYKSTEMINFAQGDFMMFGAFVMIWLANDNFLGLPFIIAIPCALIIMAFLSFSFDKCILQRIVGEPQIVVVILTIAAGFILRFFAGVFWGYEPLSLETPIVGKYGYFMGAVLSLAEIGVIILTVLLTILLYALFYHTKLGIALIALSQNQLAASYVGIPVKKLQSLTWSLAGIVACIAGILYASKGAVDPSVGLIGIKAFAAAVIGGFGSLPGALLGGLIIGVVEPFSARFIGSGYSHLMPYIILLVILIVKPNGLISQVKNKKV